MTNLNWYNSKFIRKIYSFDKNPFAILKGIKIIQFVCLLTINWIATGCIVRKGIIEKLETTRHRLGHHLRDPQELLS